MAKADVIVGWTGETGQLPDSVRFVCALCGATVWLTPSGQAAQAEGAAVWCIPCANRNVQQFDEVTMAPGALGEFVDSLKRDRN
jgi:hypothetical protein